MIRNNKTILQYCSTIKIKTFMLYLTLEITRRVFGRSVHHSYKKWGLWILKFTSIPVMSIKRELKPWWSAIQPIATKRTATSNLKSFNTKKTTTYADENSGSCLGQAHDVWRSQLIVIKIIPHFKKRARAVQWAR